MLVRVYRLTDKLGLVILKTAAATGDWLLEGMTISIDTVSSGSLGILSLLAAIALAIVHGFRAIVQLFYRLLQSIARSLLAILAAMWRVLHRIALIIVAALALIVGGGRRLSGRSVSSAGVAARVAGTRATGATSDAMARRAARQEIDAGLAEDPLRVQNRALSVWFVILGVIIIGVILWATDPARSGTIPVPASNTDFTLLSAVEATSIPADTVNAASIPTTTPIPEVLQVRGTIAYVVREMGQQDIWAVAVGSRNQIRLTNDPADERDPAWSPVTPAFPNRRLAYASNRDGNWEIFIYDLDEQLTTRMTYDLSFQAAPQWSPDGQWLVYESYQGENLDVYAMPVDGSEAPVRITDHPAPDFAPMWSPGDGRQIAYVSWQDGNQDIYIFDLNTLESFNLTNTPNRNENDVAWSPDGRRLTFSAVDQGQELVFVQDVDAPGAVATVIGVGRSPVWSPDGSSLSFAVNSLDGQTTYLSARPFADEGVATEVIAVPFPAGDPTWTDVPLPPALVNAGGLNLSITEPLYIEQVDTRNSDPPYRLNSLLDVRAPNPNLSDQANDSFNALRQAVLAAAGWDFLGQLDDAFWPIDRRPQPGEERRNWHMTGRAFSFARNSILGFPPPIEIIREDLGVDTRWRIYIRVADEAQSGQLGEPLRQIPWDFLSRSGGDVEAYNQGGRLRDEIPGGYYIDLTQLALDYGWEHAVAGSDWRANANSINYWLFLKTDGLDWYSAMREIYAESQLGGFVPTPVPSGDTG